MGSQKLPQSSRTHELTLDILGIFSAIYMMARERMASRKCPELRSAAEFDEMAWRLNIAQRELALWQSRFQQISPHKRPVFAPEDRFEVLQLMALAGWSVKETARRLLIHPNTIRHWRKAAKHGNLRFLGHPPFNKMGDAVRWLVHEIRSLCPDPSFGTRAIAMQIIRAGIQVSRSTVQRILREKKPKPIGAAANSDAQIPKTPFSILRPKKINQTWHLDLTTFEFLIVRFYVAGLLDGFSRKLLALRVYRDAPTTKDMLALVRASIREHGKPRVLVTDGGCQFRSAFKHSLKRRGIELIKGRDAKRFNGKIERFFRTLKWWKRLTLLAPSLFRIQPRLDVFRLWYNTERPMFILGGRTPDETWRGERPPRTKPILARNPQPEIRVTRERYGGDIWLPKINIKVIRSVQRVA